MISIKKLDELGIKYQNLNIIGDFKIIVDIDNQDYRKYQNSKVTVDTQFFIGKNDFYKLKLEYLPYKNEIILDEFAVIFFNNNKQNDFIHILNNHLKMLEELKVI